MTPRGLDQVTILTGLICFLTCATCLAQDASTSRPSTRLYEFGAAGLYDGSLQVTGVVQAGRYFDIVGVSTPTTPNSNHASLFLNDTSKALCATYDDGSSSCFAASGGSFLSTSSATATYLQTNNASSTYLTQSSATATYSQIKTFTGSNGIAVVPTATTLTISVSSVSLSTQVVGNLPASQVAGTTTNNNASAGLIGEILSSGTLRTAALPTTTATPLNIASLVLTAGDWDVRYAVGFKTGGSTVLTLMIAALSTTSATLPASTTDAFPDSTGQCQNVEQGSYSPGSGNDIHLVGLTSRVSIASTTTYYLVARADFSVSTLTSYGSMTARRER